MPGLTVPYRFYSDSLVVFVFSTILRVVAFAFGAWLLSREAHKADMLTPCLLKRVEYCWLLLLAICAESKN